MREIRTLALRYGPGAAPALPKSFHESARHAGHSHAEANAILEAHYLHRDPAIAWSAIRKLEAMAVKLPERDSGALRLKEFATDALQGRALALAADGTTDLNSAVPAGTVAERSVSREAGNRQPSDKPRPLFHSRERGKANEIKWLGDLNAFRTICIDSKGEIRSLFEELRTACHFVV